MEKKKNKIGEQRYLVEFRAEPGENDEMVIEGYAIVFDSPATHKAGKYTFTETIRSGSLQSCNMEDVPLRYNHNNTWLVLARTRNKSLQLVVDEKGLKIRATLIDTQQNRDIYAAVKAGLLDKMSFAFTVAEHGDEWTYGDRSATRTVTKIDRLYDVSIVDVPFYDDTEVYARTLEMLESNGQTKLESFEVRKRKSIALLRLSEDK